MTCFRFKNGKTVSQWCKENGVPFNSVWRHLDNGLMPEEACVKAINNKGNKRRVKYFYKGKPVIDILGKDTKEYFKFLYRMRDGCNSDCSDLKAKDYLEKYGVEK